MMARLRLRDTSCSSEDSSAALASGVRLHNGRRRRLVSIELLRVSGS